MTFIVITVAYISQQSPPYQNTGSEREKSKQNLLNIFSWLTNPISKGQDSSFAWRWGLCCLIVKLRHIHGHLAHSGSWKYHFFIFYNQNNSNLNVLPQSHKLSKVEGKSHAADTLGAHLFPCGPWQLKDMVVFVPPASRTRGFFLRALSGPWNLVSPQGAGWKCEELLPSRTTLTQQDEKVRGWIDLSSPLVGQSWGSATLSPSQSPQRDGAPVAHSSNSDHYYTTSVLSTPTPLSYYVSWDDLQNRILVPKFLSEGLLFGDHKLRHPASPNCLLPLLLDNIMTLGSHEEWGRHPLLSPRGHCCHCSLSQPTWTGIHVQGSHLSCYLTFFYKGWQSSQVAFPSEVLPLLRPWVSKSLFFGHSRGPLLLLFSKS